MLITVNEFCEAVSKNMNDLIDQLTAISGRGGPGERRAWENSLPKLSKALASAQLYNSDIKDTHLYLGHLTLEYKLPSASAWCDAVLLGNNTKSPQVLIIELKNWDTSSDDPGVSESLILHKGKPYLHPSEQLKGYTLYCSRFHSAVLEDSAAVNGCVYFTRNSPIEPYKVPPHNNLVKEFPIFNLTDEEQNNAFSKFISSQIAYQDEQFAKNFEDGIYKQDRNILIQVAQNMKRSQDKPFELIDEQRKGYYLVLKAIDESTKQKNKKQVIIIEGPPGSGKSALAANLWIESALQYNEYGNIVFVTTSSSQKSNWSEVFNRTSQLFSGEFMILPANQYNPGLSPALVKRFREFGHKMDADDWEENLKIFTKNGRKYRTPDNQHFISIVDEAHALINPVGHNLGFPRGWCPQAGPQVFHIIRASKISVFLLDCKQSFRDSETTSIEDIYNYARMLNADIKHIDLGGLQFRCGGSKEYVDWVETLFDIKKDTKLDTSWRKLDSNATSQFIFEIVDTPHDLDNVLSLLFEKGSSVRLISSYSVPWKTKDKNDIHKLPPHQQDFVINYVHKGEKKTWVRPWNYAPKEDYTMFIQAVNGSEMSKNPLAEVGCPYVVRGFDFDYLGVLWLNDLVWREDKWVIQFDNIHETALRMAIAEARRGNIEKLEMKIKLAYRILLTRALRGIYLYIHDPETNAHIESLLNDNK